MTAATDQANRAVQLSAPPVLLLWALSFVLFSVPNVPDLWRQGLDRLEMQRQLELFGLSAVWYPAAFNQLVPFVAIAVALGIAVIPYLRGYVVRKRYGLQPAGDSPPALQEIVALVRSHLPDAVVMANLRRARSMAFVYTEGWSAPGFAVFGGIVQLWRSDRQAAEAVLLHEIEHARQRDYFVAGTGTTLRLLVPVMVLILLIGSTLLSVESAFLYGWQFGLTDIDAATLGVVDVFRHPVSFLGHAWTLGWLAGSLGILALSMTLVLVPVAAIWVMELNADRVASSRVGRQRLIDTINGTHIVGFRDRVLRYFLHPPHSLRIWALRQNAVPSVLVMLLLIPVAYLLSLLLLHFWAFTEWLQFEFLVLQLVHASLGDATRAAISATLDGFWANSRYWFTAHPTRWVLLAGLIATWPIVASFWRSSPGGSSEPLPSSAVVVSLLSGGLVLVIAGLAFALS